MFAVLPSSCRDQEPPAAITSEAANVKGNAAPKTSKTTNKDVAYAQSLWVGPDWANGAFVASVETMESMPPQFALRIAEKSFLTKTKLDEFTPANEKGIMVVKCTMVPNESGRPEDASMRVTLGKLKVGTYKLQLFLAMKGEEAHRLLQTFELTAN